VKRKKLLSRTLGQQEEGGYLWKHGTTEEDVKGGGVTWNFPAVEKNLCEDSER